VSLTRRLDERLGIGRASSLLDGAFAVLLGLSLAVCYATGVPVAGLAAVVVGAFGLQYLVDGRVAEDAFAAADGAGDAPRELKRTVGDLSVDLGIDAPRAVFEPGGEVVTVLGDGDRAVVVVGESLVAELDEASLRGVLAHELAHVALGHFPRVAVRKPIAHVVGFTAFWVLGLQYLVAGFAMMGGAAYLAAGAGRTNGVFALLYVVASGGVVLIPMALSAYATRLEECQADDLAVEHSSPRDFCGGLYRVGTGLERPDGAMVGSTPLARGRSVIGRLAAVHPTVEYRLERQGFAPGDFE
jgi:Zn-dependent protease with chaperone function